MPSVRHWVATFNTKEPNMDLFIGRYMIVAEELAPTTGHKHWQCYMEFQQPMSMKKIKAMFQDQTIYLAQRLGSREQARDYCKTPGKFITYKEYGIWATGQGFRTDLKMITDKMIEGTKRIQDVALEEPTLYCKYRNGLKDIQGIVDKNKSREFRKVEVIVISGPTGTGKTKQAYEDSTIPYKIDGSELNWWDGYDAEKTILIDEYDNDVKLPRLLNITDGYQLRLAIKGGFTYAQWNKVYITTNLRKHELHAQAKPAHRDALFRRITKWIDLWPTEDIGI